MSVSFTPFAPPRTYYLIPDQNHKQVQASRGWLRGKQRSSPAEVGEVHRGRAGEVAHELQRCHKDVQGPEKIPGRSLLFFFWAWVSSSCDSLTLLTRYILTPIRPSPDFAFIPKPFVFYVKRHDVHFTAPRPPATIHVTLASTALTSRDATRGLLKEATTTTKS